MFEHTPFYRLYLKPLRSIVFHLRTVVIHIIKSVVVFVFIRSVLIRFCGYFCILASVILVVTAIVCFRKFIKFGNRSRVAYVRLRITAVVYIFYVVNFVNLRFGYFYFWNSNRVRCFTDFASKSFYTVLCFCRRRRDYSVVVLVPEQSAYVSGGNRRYPFFFGSGILGVIFLKYLIGRFALLAGFAFLTLVTLRSLRSGFTLFALVAFISLGSLSSGFAFFALFTLRTLCAGFTLFALVTFITLGSLFAGFTLFAFNSNNPRLIRKRRYVIFLGINDIRFIRGNHLLVACVGDTVAVIASH